MGDFGQQCQQTLKGSSHSIFHRMRRMSCHSQRRWRSQRLAQQKCQLLVVLLITLENANLAPFYTPRAARMVPSVPSVICVHPTRSAEGKRRSRLRFATCAGRENKCACEVGKLICLYSSTE